MAKKMRRKIKARPSAIEHPYDEVDGEFFDDQSIEDSLDAEGDETLASITEPFDPRKIDVTLETQNVQYLLDLLEDEHIDLNTEFQRSADLWTPTKMSRLIESLMIRLPIPPFYLAAVGQLPTTDQPLQVVDGLQRLSSLKRFALDGSLRLKGMSFLKELEGKRFEDLERHLQRALTRAQITVYIIRPGTPKSVTYILFERLNTGGLTLNPQEIRNALNQGKPAQYVKDLVSVPSFKKLVNLSPGRMKDCELALRYYAFRRTPPTDYRRPLREFLDSAMEDIAKTPERKLSHLRNTLEKALSTAYNALGPNAFSKQESRRQFNRALFEAWAVNLSELSQHERALLCERSELLNKLYRAELADETSMLSYAITLRTSDEDAVKNRFSEVKKLIRKVLKS